MNYKPLLPTWRTRQRWLRDTLAALDPRPRRLLDLGCGEGDLAADLAASADEVDACDVNAGDVAHARAAHADLRHVRWHVADAGGLPFADATFDAATAVDVLEHVPDAGRALRELARVVRPGGALLVTVPNARFPLPYDPLHAVLARGRRILPVGAYAYGHTVLRGEAEWRAAATAEGWTEQGTARLSHALVGAIEAYGPGLAQRLAKANAANRAAPFGRALRPTRAPPPPFLPLVDALIDLDRRLFGARPASVGLAFLLRRA